MDLAVGGGVLKLIFTLVVAIRASASTAKQNKEDCLQIARRAGKLHATLAAGAHTLAEATRKHPAVASVLDDLRLALVAVVACHKDCGALIRLLKAAKVSAQLRLLNRDIEDRIMDVLLVTSLYTNGLVYAMHQHQMEQLQIQRQIMMHRHRMEHDRSHRPVPQLQIEAYGCSTHSNQSLSNQSYAIQPFQASPPVPERTTSSIPCQIEWRAAAVPEDDVDFRRQARESNIEPRVVVLLILVLLLLGTRCGLERLLILYLWRWLFRLG